MIVFDLDGVITESEDEFWWIYLPNELQRYGKSKEEVIEVLSSTEVRIRNSLDWSSVEFWASELGIEEKTFLEIYNEYEKKKGPRIYEDFKKFVGEYGESIVYIATATDPKMLNKRIKDIEELLESTGKKLVVFNVFDIGYSKMEREFWKYVKMKTNAIYVVDDRPDYLQVAKEFFEPIFILRENEFRSQARPVQGNFKTIKSLEELCSLIGTKEK